MTVPEVCRCCWDARRRRQRVGIDPPAAGGEFVTHGQCQAGQVQGQHLCDESYPATQRGGVGDQHDRIGPPDVAEVTGDNRETTAEVACGIMPTKVASWPGAGWASTTIESDPCGES